MQIQQLKDIGIVTEQLAASRDFYERLLGFEAVFVSEWYIHLKNGPVELGLMTPRETFAAVPAGGVWVSVEVASADAEYERLAAAGARLDGKPEDRPWGERCFVVRDPNGFGINLSQTIAMDEAFMRTQNQLTHAAG
jgi:catechol 2,3-dioxygenase-like lactoylglutathione lyase family enzyme